MATDRKGLDETQAAAADPSVEDTQAAADPSVEDTQAVAAVSGGEEAHVASRGRSPRRAVATETVERGTSIGRYVVLSRLGAGGMGVVYAAYDPELDRKVALKLLRSDGKGGTVGSDGSTRLLREAQALAKLAHPNVVTVHDVGTKGDRVWIAMEFVEGQTLGSWMADPPPHAWPEVVEVIGHAARGLAAAHAAGLLHRDFKPDNVMIGADGRVRVMDFGLARLDARAPSVGEEVGEEPRSLPSSISVTRTGAMMGTPAYMAPEQMEGRADERSDQFSLCVTMWEALYGERPFAGETVAELVGTVLRGELRAPPRGRRVPVWLRRVCQRGLATRPGDRHASVATLLSAIERGQARRRRIRIMSMVGGLLVLGAGLMGQQRYQRSQRIAACEAQGAEIEALWNDEARARVRAGLIATGAEHATTTADKVMPWLDEHADTWRELRTQACLRAEVEQTWTPAVLDRAQWCFAERRDDLRSLVEQLEHATTQQLHGAVPAASGLSRISPCLESSVLDHLPELPAQTDRGALAELRMAVAEIRTLSTMGQFAEAQARIDVELPKAEALGWPPMVARLLQVQGVVLGEMGDFEASERVTIDAYTIAARSSAWGIAARAANSLTHVVGYDQARYAEGRLWAKLGEVAESFAGDPLRLREASRKGNLAAIAFLQGSYEESATLAEQSLQLRREELGLRHPQVATSLSNMAITYHRVGRTTEALEALERAYGIQVEVLGPLHPEVSRTLANWAVALKASGRFDQAREKIEQSLAIREQVLPSDHPDLAASLDTLAALEKEAGEYEQALAHGERALAIREKRLGTQHPSYVGSLNNLANVYHQLEQMDRATALYERAAEILEQSEDADSAVLGRILLNLGYVYASRGDHERAEQRLREAITRIEAALGPEHADIASAQYRLGYSYAQQERYDEAIEAYERAVAIYDLQEGEPDNRPLTMFRLANAMVAAGRDRDAAVAWVRRAREELEAPAIRRQQILRDEVDVWLAEHAEATVSP